MAARLVALIGTASQGALRKWSGLGLGVYVVLSTPKPEGSAHIRMWSSRALRCLETGRLWQHRQSSLNTTFGLKSCHYGAVKTQAAGRQSGWRTPHTALGDSVGYVQRCGVVFFHPGWATALLDVRFLCGIGSRHGSD